jgi:hypothetical protein
VEIAPVKIGSTPREALASHDRDSFRACERRAFCNFVGIGRNPAPGNNPKQVAADQLRGSHCRGPRSEMTAVSSAAVALIRDGAMRNYSRIFCGEGVAVSNRFGTFGSVEHRSAGGLFPGNDLGQNNPEKDFFLDQWLTRKARSHLRVICATPI